jgi:hypothetical protein
VFLIATTQEEGLCSKAYDIVKSLLISREMLLEKVKKISNIIGGTLEDLDDADLTLGKYETVHPSKSCVANYSKGHRAPTKYTRQLSTLRDFLDVCFIFLGKN